MRLSFVLFFIIVPLLSFAKDCKIQAGTPALNEHYCRGKALFYEAQKVFRTQPYLYSSPAFKDMQAWTRFYQRKKPQRTPLGLVVRNPGMSNIKTLTQAFTELNSDIAKLVGELPFHLVLHDSFTMDTKDRDSWRRDLKQTMETMEISISGTENIYKMHNCDYVSQPLNVLWYWLNALEIINNIGEEKYGEEWRLAINGKKQFLGFMPTEIYQELFGSNVSIK